jgi:hypothetical protein
MGKQLIKKTQGCSWLENKIIEKQLKPSTLLSKWSFITCSDRVE